MTALQFELLEGERVILEKGPAVLTNKRLLANWHSVDGQGQQPADQAFLKDIASFKKLSGGQESRVKPGLRWLGLGVAIIVAEVILTTFDIIPAGTLVESILFLVGALALVVGLYMLQSSLFRTRPHTTVFFSVPGSPDIAVTFPGRNNPDADELTRQFLRAKRGL